MNKTKYKTRSVKENALLSVIKQILTIVFPMITFPYATRVLGVLNYGKISFSSSIVEYVSLIAAAGISRYAIREVARVRNNKKELTDVVNELFTINIISTVISFGFLLLLLACWPRLRSYTAIILVQSLTVLFTTVGTDWINSAFEDYYYITVRYIVSQSIAVLLMFILVRSHDDYVMYAFTSSVGVILANIFNYIHIRRSLKIIPRFIVNASLKKRIKPVLYMFICSIASTIYVSSDITILNIFTNDTIVGYYSASTKFYNMIKQVINAAFVVVIPRISNELSRFGDEDKGVNLKLDKILNIIILLCVPASVGLFMTSRNILLLFSGSDYLPAAPSLRILAVALIPATLANFFVNIVMIPFFLEKKVTIETVLSAVVNIVLNFVFIPFFQERAAAFTTLTAECVMMFMGTWYTRNIIKPQIIKSVFASLLGAAVVFIICLWVNTYINNVILNLLLCIILSVVCYCADLFAFFRKEMMLIIRRKR